jgi:hypothetical protein
MTKPNGLSSNELAVRLCVTLRQNSKFPERQDLLSHPLGSLGDEKCAIAGQGTETKTTKAQSLCDWAPVRPPKR